MQFCHTKRRRLSQHRADEGKGATPKTVVWVNQAYYVYLKVNV